MIELFKHVNIKGYTFIVPCVSVGNISQLSADIFIMTLNMKKAGKVWHKSIMPVFGSNPYKTSVSDSAITSEAELYYSEEKKLIILQIRSSIMGRAKNDFFKELSDFIKANEISKVILLTSDFAHTLKDNCEKMYFGELSFKFLASSDMDEKYANDFKELNWTPCEPEKIIKINEAHADELYNFGVPDFDKPPEYRTVKYFGPGYGKQLYDICVSQNIPTVLLVKYCAEGDNRPDAIKTTADLNKWVHVLKEDETGQVAMKIPECWKYVFGDGPPAAMF